MNGFFPSNYRGDNPNPLLGTFVQVITLFMTGTGPLLHYELQIPIVYQQILHLAQKETKAVLDDQNEMKDPGANGLPLMK